MITSDRSGRPEGRKSVMVLSAAAGAGHVSAAAALVSAFDARGVSAEHVEVLKYTNSVFRSIYADLYKELANKRPEVLGWVYKSLDRPWKYQKRRLALDRFNAGPLLKLLRKEQPDVAVCTHFLPAEILIYLRRKGVLDVPVGIVITDLDAHAMWLYRGVDWYFVACDETRAYLTALGIPEESVHVTGIPVNPAFADDTSKKGARLGLGLRPDMTTLLVSAGGFGVGPVEALIRGLHDLSHPVQIVVVCGRNAELERRLLQMRDVRHPMKVVGYTSEMHVWMAASDMLVGKAGGLTSSEALAKGLVLCIVNPIPGQEERNADHFLEDWAAIRCNDLPTLAYKIDRLLGDEKRFRRMQKAALTLGRPRAAADIVSIILEQGGLF
jgi:processive 1,2-diacylglycerol beta-glucosyltransferase